MKSAVNQVCFAKSQNVKLKKNLNNRYSTKAVCRQLIIICLQHGAMTATIATLRC